MARKSKMSSTLCDNLCKFHSDGLPLKSCADLCGVSRQTVYNWLKEGESAKSGMKREFYLNWQKARVMFEAYHLKKISESKDWRASQYLLQCISPNDYVVEERTRINADVKQEHSNLDEFARIMRESK